MGWFVCVSLVLDSVSIDCLAGGFGWFDRFDCCSVLSVWWLVIC